MKLDNLSVTEILNEIGNHYGDSLLEKIMDFTESNDIDPKELGDILEEDEAFKEMLLLDCIKNNQIVGCVKNNTENLCIW
jgi:DNA-binding ferritin-like protein (Dps family)